MLPFLLLLEDFLTHNLFVIGLGNDVRLDGVLPDFDANIVVGAHGLLRCERVAVSVGALTHWTCAVTHTAGRAAV